MYRWVWSLYHSCVQIFIELTQKELEEAAQSEWSNGS